MAGTSRKTNDVLASARKELQAQLAVVREEITRLAAEERALTQGLSSLDGDSGSSSSAPAANPAGRRTRSAKGPARKGSAGRSTRRRRPRGASKPTADRLTELRGLLNDGPKSRNDLAAALKVSPARVQQLLAALGTSVSAQPAPGQRQGKLWSLEGGGNGASAAKPRSKTKGTATRTPTARKAAETK